MQAAVGNRIRVLISDDSRTFRQVTRQLLLTSEDIEVVGEAADGLSALEEVERLRPDVVLMDCRMPGMDGIDATRRIRSQFPTTAVVGISSDVAGCIDEMREAGADEVLEKGAGPEELGQVIRTAARNFPSEGRPHKGVRQL